MRKTAANGLHVDNLATCGGGRGGRRPGAGRPRGSAHVRTREVANRLAREGLTPLEVLVNTMKDLWGYALQATTDTERIEWKMRACAIAEKAAVFVHPRLAAVAATMRTVTSVKDLSDAELAALIRSLGSEVIESTPEQTALPAGQPKLN